MNHDQGFKHLLSAYFLEFLDLFAPEVRAFAEPDSLVFLDKEVFADLPDGQRGEADLLASLRVAGSERIFLVHLEHEAQYRNDFERRMFFYYARLLERHGLDIYPLAVLSYPRRRTLQPDRFVVEFPCLRPLVFQFQVIELNALRWRDYLESPNPVGACLLPFMGPARGQRAEVKAASFKMLVGLELEPTRLGFLFQFVDSYLPLRRLEEKRKFDAEIAQMSRKEREAVMQYTTSWEREGLVRGRQEGRQEGLRRAVELQIKDRFQADASSLLEDLSRVHEEKQLDAIVLALGRQVSLEELKRLLA